jgi:hypothetical protein
MAGNEGIAVLVEKPTGRAAAGSHDELATMKTLRKSVRRIGLDATKPL